MVPLCHGVKLMVVKINDNRMEFVENMVLFYYDVKLMVVKMGVEKMECVGNIK